MHFLIFFLLFFNVIEARNIFIVGDSHTEEFLGIPDIKIVHLGSVTMHRVGRETLDTQKLFSLGCDVYALDYANPRYSLGSPLNSDEIDLIRMGEIPVQDGDAVLYSLGQIDAGWHIYKQAQQQNRSVEAIVDDVVFAFMSSITRFPHAINIIYSITPPIDYPINPPYEGSLEERVQITKYFNQRLKQACKVYDFEFLDVYDDYANDQGSLRPELSRGDHHIHYAQNHYIHKKLMDILSFYK
jgi:hypothetical protein